VPDVIVGHPGWGEPLFAKQVWPETRLGLYAKFFYQLNGADVGYDPEFAPPDPEADACRLQMKNLNHLAHLDQADGALSPTHWQASTFPPPGGNASAWRTTALTPTCCVPSPMGAFCCRAVRAS
jgi:hypothetical protein